MLTCIAYAIKKVSTSTLPVVNSSALVLWTFLGWLELNKTREFLTFWQGKLALAMPKKRHAVGVAERNLNLCVNLETLSLRSIRY
jgi:hypothetical protein